MKADAITLREIAMPLVRPFETSFGRTTERRILLITIHADGIEGWGECTAGEGPFYNEESVDTAWYVIERFLGPMVLDRELAHPRDAAALMASVRGHRMAKAAVENAFWDAEAQALNMPLWKLVGGERREIACGVSIGLQASVDELIERVGVELVAGYRRIKIKVKPSADVKLLAAIRSRWPKILLSCDANSAYVRGDFPHLKQFDDYKLLMIEQPLWNDDIATHADLQREINTAICLDESILHARHAEQAIAAGACRIINIKLGRVGGFTEARRVHDVCAAAGVPNWCGGMLESGVGRSHNIAMSTLPNFSLPGDVSASARYWAEDVVEPEITVSHNGLIDVPQSPGRGFEVKADFVEKLTVRKTVLRH